MKDFFALVFCEEFLVDFVQMVIEYVFMILMLLVVVILIRRDM